MRFKFLLILGLIFLVVGGLVIATNLGDTPHGGWQVVHRPGGRTVNYMNGGGMLIMGGTFVFVGVVLSIVSLMVGRSAAATAQLLATGLAGQATITGLTQTGAYLNRQPQVSMNLMVNVTGRAPYPVRHEEFVPLIMLGRLSSGAPLSVRVDPANPQRLAIDWSNTAFAAQGPLV